MFGIKFIYHISVPNDSFDSHLISLIAFAPPRRAWLPSFILAQDMLGPFPWVHTDDAAGFTLCYGLLGCDDFASVFGSPLDRKVTTRPLGPYLDRTSTG
jgi:hypothetical protein